VKSFESDGIIHLCRRLSFAEPNCLLRYSSTPLRGWESVHLRITLSGEIDSVDDVRFSDRRRNVALLCDCGASFEPLRWPQATKSNLIFCDVRLLGLQLPHLISTSGWHCLYLLLALIVTPIGQLISNDNDTYHFFSEANTTECVKPRVFVEDPVLQVLWHFIYWSGQILTWVALPVIQSYALSGEFSSMKKMKSVEQGARRRYRIGVYFRVDPSELEGVKLRSQRLTNREDSPLRCAAYRNARSKNYGSARIQASRPLLDAWNSTSTDDSFLLT